MLATLKLEPRTITPEPLTIHSFTLTTIILPAATHRRAGSQSTRGEPKDLEPLTLNPEPTIIPVSHISDS